jgi:hypothetical protein
MYWGWSLISATWLWGVANEARNGEKILFHPKIWLQHLQNLTPAVKCGELRGVMLVAEERCPK